MNDLLKQMQALIPLAEAATQGPWTSDKGAMVSAPAALIAAFYTNTQLDGKQNAAFIAAARNVLTPENLLALCAALAVPGALPAPYSGICTMAALGGLTKEQAYDWRSNGMNGQYDDTFDAGVLHGHAELATALLAISAAATTEGAQPRA